MNLGELRRAAQDFAGVDDADTHVTPVEWNRFINRAHKQLGVLINGSFKNFFKAETYLSEVLGERNITTPANMTRMVTFQRVAGYGATDINRVPMKRDGHRNQDLAGMRFIDPSTDQSRTGNVHNRYSLHGQKQITLLLPPEASRTDSLRLEFIFAPADMTEDEHVPFQEIAGPGGAGTDLLNEHHDLIWMSAVMLSYAKEEALNQYQALKAEYRDGLNLLMRDLEVLNEEPLDVGVSEDNSHLFDTL